MNIATTTAKRYLSHEHGVARRVRKLRMRVTAGPDRGQEAVFSGKDIFVGSDPENDFPLTDPSVSRHHLEIVTEREIFVARDLGSTNGSFAGTLRLGHVGILGATELTLGETVLEVLPLAEEDEQILSPRVRCGDLVGQSPAMLDLFDKVERLAGTDTNVLIFGETGTGKEVVAETIHALSNRREHPLVVVDCTSIPEALFESHLFGHQKGAFTGAIAEHRGAFEQAHRGTLFLDEISDLGARLQPKLLRALETRTIRRLGDKRSRSVDVRVIAASRRDLSTDVQSGAFREDLYYRLVVARIHVPPLRERKDDIPLLATHFIQRFLDRRDDDPPPRLEDHLSAPAIDRLWRHDWPGNVRELRNALERAILVGVDPLAGNQARNEALGDLPYAVAKERTIAAFEKEYVRTLLDRWVGNISAAARAAGLNRRSLQRLIQRCRDE